MRTRCTWLALLFAVACGCARAESVINFNLEADEERNSIYFMERYGPLATYLSRASDAPLHLTYGQDPKTALQRTRGGFYDVVVGPAHVIGTAVRYGYVPVGHAVEPDHVVFVVRKDSGLRNFDELKGKTIGMPPEDSLATYIARGEFNALHIEPKKFFAQVSTYRFHGAALIGVTNRIVDVAVIDEHLLERWPQKDELLVVRRSHDVPGMGVAVNKNLPDRVQRKFAEALLTPSSQGIAVLATSQIGTLRKSDASEYSYISTLGYFTPTLLPGAKLVTAEQVKELMASGVPLIDTRVADEYKDGHVVGARSLPYGEKSNKEIDFDASLDRFDTTPLGPNKSAPLIFQCNGPECWKSYKASVAAMRAGYTNIYWFRGGFPEWRAKGLPIKSGND